MNVHPDMLRGSVPMHQSILNQGFLPQQAQQGQQSTPHAMGILQNNQGGNPGLGIMGGQPGTGNPNHSLAMQQANSHRRAFMPQHSNGPSLNPGAGAGPSHMAGLPPNQLQGMPGFPGMMPQQPGIRRVQSQPHMPGMPPNMIANGMVPPIRHNMNPAQQQLHIQMLRQQQQQGGQGSGMSPDSMGLPMNRHMQGANPIPPHVRSASGQQMMPTLTQPPTLPQTHGMQQQMQHSAFGNPMPLQHQHQHQQSSLGSSQHVGSSGQQQSNMAGNPISSQASGGRAQMSPDNLFMNIYQNPMQPQLSHNVPRMPMNNMSNPPFNMASSPAPLNPGVDISQRGNPSMDGSGPLTPAQVLEMNNGANGFATTGYGMGQAPASAPTRPPSHNGPHNPFPVSQSQPSLPSQQSPRQPDHLPTQMHAGPGGMQRPQSQPQVAHRQSPIPNPSRTPRVSQPSLPMNAGSMMPPRVPTAGPAPSPQGPSHQPAQPPPNAPSQVHPTQPGSRPQTAVAASSTALTTATSTNAAPPPGQIPVVGEGSQSTTAAIAPTVTATAVAAQPPATRRQISLAGINRVLQFSAQLTHDSTERLQMPYWNTMMSTYFSEKAIMKLTLWKDNQQIEAKPFEIGYPIFSRFFLVTAQSGVKSQSINIDSARERLITSERSLVECFRASWTFRYTNGCCITLRGPFTVEVAVVPVPSPPHSVNGGPPIQEYNLLFERLQFDAFWHDKYLAYDAILGQRIADSARSMPSSPSGNPNGTDDANCYESRYLIDHAIIPAEPINAFGIPQATMRCLELAESVAQMSDLIQYSISTKMGPKDALTAFAEKIRQERVAVGLHAPPNGIDHYSSGIGHLSHPDRLNGTSVVTSGPSASFGPPGHIPGPSQAQSGVHSQGSHPDGSSKQAKGTSQQAQASGSTPGQTSTPVSAPTPGGPTTPSMANASLKRKAPPAQRSGEDSPTTANAEQQPAKRQNRKRGRTQGS